jgi:protein transport protein SEC24
MLTKNYSWESVFRIRISSGWRIKSIFGNYSIKANDLLTMNNCEEN